MNNRPVGDSLQTVSPQRHEKRRSSHDREDVHCDLLGCYAVGTDYKRETHRQGDKTAENGTKENKNTGTETDRTRE
jgi:hypothetical protein